MTNFQSEQQKTAESRFGGFFSVYRLTPLLCLLGLFLALHGRALLPQWQYGFRDAGHFYYPLNQRVQMEWDSGRWPLWEPEENGGMPLLGNPTAAVFYPLKVLFFLFDYPTAAKSYILVHQVLCWLNLWLLARSLGLSKFASWLGSTIYAFSVPILFQYCNVIFLIGAAWLPLGLKFGWQWILNRRIRDIIGLGVVIALQILGGDPQVGYLTLLCLAGLSFWEGITDRGRHRIARIFQPFPLLLWLGLLTFGTILSAQFPMPPRELKIGSQPLWERLIYSRNLWQLTGWSIFGLMLANRWRKNWRSQPMPRVLFGIGLATLLGAGLSAVQLLPVMEYNSLSVRSAAEGPHDVYPFSIEPYRLVEMLFPRVFGTVEHGNHYWLSLLPPINNHKQWVPSLYHGLPAVVLTLSVLRFRKANGLVRAFSILLAISIIGAMGEFTGPLWLLRRLPGLGLAGFLGPPDPTDVAAFRFDGFPRDGDGGLYWLLAEIFPAFRTFRYPAKLFTFASLAMAVLAAIASDRLSEIKVSQRFQRIGIILSATALLLILISLGFRNQFMSWVAKHPAAQSSIYGPVDATSAFQSLLLSLIQTLALSVLLLVILRFRQNPKAYIPALSLIVVLDLGLANSVHVNFVPQELFDRESEILTIIRSAEAEKPTSGGLYRIHRMPVWNPPGWNTTPSVDREREFVEWEHRTIQPKYGITQDTQYTLTEGTTELYDFWWFFGPFYRRLPAEAARTLNVPPNSEIAYHPRRGYDLWNTRYFVTPGWPGDWKNDKRSFASFLFDSELIYPSEDLKKNPDRKAELEHWARFDDVQIFRNNVAYPRAWIVHEMRVYPHIEGLRRRDREAVMTEILFQHDPFWFDGGREIHDPKVLCWIDQNDQERVRPFMAGRVRSGSSESVVIDSYSPQRVEMTANLEKPGIVILADVYYPGWKLTVDGQPQEVVRVNRMMRGALVPSGNHRIVYTFDPSSFRLGARISTVSLIAVLALGLLSFRNYGRTKDAIPSKSNS